MTNNSPPGLGNNKLANRSPPSRLKVQLRSDRAERYFHADSTCLPLSFIGCGGQGSRNARSSRTVQLPRTGTAFWGQSVRTRFPNGSLYRNLGPIMPV